MTDEMEQLRRAAEVVGLIAQAHLDRIWAESGLSVRARVGASIDRELRAWRLASRSFEVPVGGGILRASEEDAHVRHLLDAGPNPYCWTCYPGTASWMPWDSPPAGMPRNPLTEVASDA